MRPAILFAALVVMATATFSDVNAWIEPLPAMRQLPIALRVALLYVPYAILVAILWFHARVQPRVQGNIAWFIALAIFAVGTVLTPYVTPALMLAITLVLMRLTPRAWTIYEGTSFPTIRAFLGFTLLAAMSIKWGADLFGMEMLLENAPGLPLDAVGAAVCAFAVGVFIASLSLRRRGARRAPAVEHPVRFLHLGGTSRRCPRHALRGLLPLALAPSATPGGR